MDIDPKSIVSLRIKKVYFDRIANREKLVEYRDFKPFYARLSSPETRYIRFHYQTSAYLLVKIKGIDVVDTPERLRLSSIPFGARVYAIALGKIVEAAI